MRKILLQRSGVFLQIHALIPVSAGHIHKQPLLLHLIELHRELMRDNVDDNLLQEALRDKRLYKQASRLMQVLSELTLLDEGFMPLPPTDDKGTRKIRNSINNHLKI